MTTFAYLRVSSELQASNNGTSAQRHAIAQWLDSQRIDPASVRWFEDSAVSGKSVDRPQWLAMNKELRGADLLVIYDLSRAARNHRELLVWVGSMLELKARVVFVKEAIDLTTLNGRLVLNVLGAIAEWQRESIVEKTRDGIKARIADGRGWAGSLPARIGKKGGRRFTDEQITAILAEHRGGVSAWELHKRHGCDYRTMRGICRNIQVDRPIAPM